VGAVIDWNPDNRRRPHHRHQRDERDTALAVVRLAATGLAVVLAPVTVAALAGYALAWWRGWPSATGVASTAEGGIWLLRTPRPGPVAELASSPAGRRGAANPGAGYPGAAVGAAPPGAAPEPRRPPSGGARGHATTSCDPAPGKPLLITSRPVTGIRPSLG
jgi:hypothetical protein